MSRPALEPLTRRLLIDEVTTIMALFSIKGEEGPFYCSLTAPADNISDALAHHNCYAYAEGATPDDAVYAARQKLWNGL